MGAGKRPLVVQSDDPPAGASPPMLCLDLERNNFSDKVRELT